MEVSRVKQGKSSSRLNKITNKFIKQKNKNENEEYGVVKTNTFLFYILEYFKSNLKYVLPWSPNFTFQNKAKSKEHY